MTWQDVINRCSQGLNDATVDTLMKLLAVKKEMGKTPEQAMGEILDCINSVKTEARAEAEKLWTTQA